MSATDELRKLLDERGIEHDDEIETFTDNWKPTNWTRWRCADGEYATYHHCEQLDLKRLVKYGCTPEQAIAATLGSDREAALEALAKDLYENAVEFNFKGWLTCYRARFKALGIEVEQ